MKTDERTIRSSIVATALLWSLPIPIHAAPPSQANWENTSKAGDFSAALSGLNAWLNNKVPVNPTDAALMALVADPAFANALDRRQLISKFGADKLAAFAKTDPAKQVFLDWLLRNTPAMNLSLEAAVPEPDGHNLIDNVAIIFVK